MIDLASELTAWLKLPETRVQLTEIIENAVAGEVRRALAGELIDVELAAEMLHMSEAAVRKAAERGQIPSVKIGKRLRFRRIDLLMPATPTGSAGSAATPTNPPRPLPRTRA